MEWCYENIVDFLEVVQFLNCWYIKHVLGKHLILIIEKYLYVDSPSSYSSLNTSCPSVQKNFLFDVAIEVTLSNIGAITDVRMFLTSLLENTSYINYLQDKKLKKL